MRNTLKAMVLAITLTANYALACTTTNGTDGFLPENDLYIPIGDKNANALTEEEFNDIIDLADKIYGPIVNARTTRFGRKIKLKWSRNWDNGTVNASASRSFWGGTWNVNMYGGLARHKFVTPDAFAMVVCHELGHHLGGTPQNSFPNFWASVEGQSDYFASLKCFRKLYGDDDNITLIKSMNIPEIVRQKCSENFSLENDQALCMRSAMAGMSLAKLLGSLRNTPNKIGFNTPDKSIVTSTDSSHPKAQCRLDTYFQGALCDKRENEDVSDDSPLVGTCNRSENYTVGVRPLCWYRPSI